MAKSLYDEFKIIQKKDLSSDDIYSLTYLYMPLLGIDSFALYIGLSTFDINESCNYKKLIDLLSLRTLQNVNSAINKLEGIGLVREYTSGENTVYALNQPLSVIDFLRDEALRVLLESEIGQDAVLLLYEKYNTSKKPVGYKDITKNFSDVFEISTENEETFWDNILGIKKDDLKIDNKEFNYVYFENLFNSDYLPEEVFKDNNFKQNILRLAKVYKLNEEQMVNCVIKSIDIDKDMTYATLAKNAKLIFRDEYQVQNPHLVSNEDDKYMDGAKDDQIIAYSERMEGMSFTDLLEWLSGTKPAEAEIAMFDEIYGDYNLSYGAINVMIMMVCKQKDGVIPPLQYFQKIAATWQRAKVKNAYDAIMFEQKQNDLRKAQAEKTGNKPVKTPSWYEDYKKQVNEAEQINEESTVDESSENIVDVIKDLFGDK